MRAYLDNAATTRLSDAAREAMLPYFDGIYGNPSSLHDEGQRAGAALQNARERIAAAIHADPGEIYFTSGGTESNNMAICSAANCSAARRPAPAPERRKRHIISSAIEHHAVLHPLEALQKEGFEITLLPVEPETGLVKPADLEAALREDTALVTIMTANNEVGTIQPIAALGELCRARGVVFHSDAVQAVGHIPVDVRAMNVDMLSLSAHKFHGPKGVGALYCRRGAPLCPLLLGGAQERSRRAGTENIPGIMGMAAALEESAAELAEVSLRLTGFRDEMIDQFLRLPRTHLNGDRLQRLPGNASLCFEGLEGEALLLLLDAKGIAASSGSACTSGSLEPSHVLLALGRPHEVAHGSLRLSLSRYTTREEIDLALEAVPQTVEYLRSISPVWDRLRRG
ncbi:MAG: IscS subfamily cysteine desulfurase [Oscillospiraceae bacterium]|nr:IscS subfamily cysteine desulfurase [Oscillospiraceae bacterium]